MLFLITLVSTVGAYELHKRRHHAIALVLDAIWVVALVMSFMP
ncbi:hypothetical protein ABIE13_003314 [Ottowia thiooxydans]|uniref:Uncharacterized protein n=1 Tax=Ottowia thiooxydans TaxID=219182 RepID=A0ABV2QAY7_9BURK